MIRVEGQGPGDVVGRQVEDVEIAVGDRPIEIDLSVGSASVKGAVQILDRRPVTVEGEAGDRPVDPELWVVGQGGDRQ